MVLEELAHHAPRVPVLELAAAAGEDDAMQSRQLIVTLQMVLSLQLLFVMPSERSEAAKRMPPPRRYTFKIPDDAPLKDLLPMPPRRRHWPT